MKFTKTLLAVFFFVSVFNGCMNQKGDSENLETEIQPELSEEGFIDLVNNILAEKVNSDMFLTLSGRSLHIRNTFDCEGKKVRVSTIRYMNEIYISVDPGHFTSMPPVPDLTGKPYSPELIDARELFTPHIETQVDLTPPSDFVTRRTYDITVMNYKGTLTVCRGHVSVYLITGALPTAPPAPNLNIYYIVAGILALVLVLVVIVLRRRKILKERWFT